MGIMFTVEESGASDTEDTAWSLEEEWLVGQAAPLNLVTQCCGANTLHLALGDLVLALLQSSKFTVSNCKKISAFTRQTTVSYIRK